MPVYDRRYRRYEGPRVEHRAGIRTIARYALAQAFSSRLALVLLVVSLLVPLGFAVYLYVVNNLDVLAAVGIQIDEELPLVAPSLFFWMLVWQSGFAFLLAAFIGPTLVAPDLAHQAMPLYLSRPVSRGEYVTGKLTALLAPLSLVTWIPGLLVVLLQASLAGWGWLADNWRVPLTLFVGSWLWNLLMALFALAVSAWVRWRPVATGAFIGLFVIFEAFGHAINGILDTRWGALLSFDDLVHTIWADLLGGVSLFGRGFPDNPLPIGACWAALGVVFTASLWMLHRKVRAFEVSR